MSRNPLKSPLSAHLIGPSCKTTHWPGARRGSYLSSVFPSRRSSPVRLTGTGIRPPYIPLERSGPMSLEARYTQVDCSSPLSQSPAMADPKSIDEVFATCGLVWEEHKTHPLPAAPIRTLSAGSAGHSAPAKQASRPLPYSLLSIAPCPGIQNIILCPPIGAPHLGPSAGRPLVGIKNRE